MLSSLRFKFGFVVTLVALIGAPRVQADPPGEGWVAFDAMTDDFDGEQLDTEKWHDHSPSWRGRRPVQFHTDCVRVEDGLLKLSVFDAAASAERDLLDGFTHVSGYIKSKAPARFGYFEARAKMMDGPLMSCFWLSQHTKEEWSEIDIAETAAGLPKYAQVVPTNAHYFFGPHYRGTPKNHLVMPKKLEMPFRLADAFHVYGVEWTPTRLRWFVDDKLVREEPNQYNFQPLLMSINLEANPYFGAVPNAETQRGEYHIDWVRAWRRPGDAPRMAAKSKPADESQD